MQAAGAPADEIAKAIGGRHSPQELMRHLKASRARMQQRKAEQAMLREDRAALRAVLVNESIEPDPAALADRDVRLGLAPRSLIAAVAGDPLPGYSALDRKQSRA